MKFLTYLVLLVFSFLTMSTTSLAAVGDINYISDVLKVPLRSGPSPGHRIIHRGLPSGTRLTILAINEEAEFTQVRTDAGTEGWVRTQYLVRAPIARMKLETAQRRLQNLQAKMEKERQTRVSIQAKYKDAETNSKTLGGKAQALEKELDELKRISGDAINQHARNVELTQQNERLVSEVSKLSSTVKRLEENVQRDWLLLGGGLVLLGLVLGVLIKARPRKSTYSRYT